MDHDVQIERRFTLQFSMDMFECINGIVEVIYAGTISFDPEHADISYFRDLSTFRHRDLWLHGAFTDLL